MFTALNIGLLFTDSRFRKDEAQFNLFCRIADGQCATALQTESMDAAALQNAGRGLWLWMNPEISDTRANAIIDSLAETLKDAKLPSAAADPRFAARFAQAYGNQASAVWDLGMAMTAYVCPEVRLPIGVAGEAIQATMEDLMVVAAYCAGFAEHLGQQVDVQSQLPAAENMIKTGNLSLWKVDGAAVSMANIAHHSPRHGRINSVYTPLPERKKGYASALTAAVSAKLLAQGLTPLLYADVANPDSNKVYRSIGYTQCGRIDDFIFTYGQ